MKEKTMIRLAVVVGTIAILFCDCIFIKYGLPEIVWLDIPAIIMGANLAALVVSYFMVKEWINEG